MEQAENRQMCQRRKKEKPNFLSEKFPFFLSSWLFFFFFFFFIFFFLEMLEIGIEVCKWDR